MSSLTSKLDRVPPVFVRLMAKHNGRLMSDRELSKKTGWSQTKITNITSRMSWAEICAKDIDTLHLACGQSWSAQRRMRWLIELAIRRGGIDGFRKMRHLKAKTYYGAGQVNKHLNRIEKLLTQ